jgi:hypothetical protein
LVSILASILSFISFSRQANICFTSIAWRYNSQDPMQCPIRPLLTPVATYLWVWLIIKGLDWMIRFIDHSFTTTRNHN